MESGLLSFLGANFIVSILLSGLLQLLWGLINTLQLVVLTVLFNIQIPINALEFMVMILKMLSLEFISTDDFLQGLFQLRKADPFYTIVSEDGIKYSKWEQSGYDSIFFVVLIGALSFMIIFYVIGVCLKSCAMRLTASWNDNVFTRFIRKHIDHTVIGIRFIFEGCIDLGISAMINMRMVSSHQLRFETYANYTLFLAINKGHLGTCW